MRSPCILPPLKTQNVLAHCQHGPLAPHKNETRQTPDKTEHHELWKQCISQGKHTSHESLVFSAVLVRADQGHSLGHEWDTRKAFLLEGFYTRVAGVNEKHYQIISRG